jgi:hypothetical protein
MNDESIDLMEILSKLKGGKAILIVELNSIWFAGGKFGCTWKLITGKFQRCVNNDITFIDDSDTEKAENTKDDDEDEEIDELSTTLDNTRVNNSDDEYVEDKKEEVIETQVTTEKKKGGRAKK